MTHESQASIEEKFFQRHNDWRQNMLTLGQAFSNFDDWVLYLGDQKAFLHPNLKQWMWYDHLHDTWIFAGCSVHEAILITMDQYYGIKKLPVKDDIRNWCVYIDINNTLELTQISEFQKSSQTYRDLDQIRIWSPQYTDWLKVNDNQFITLENLDHT